MATVVVAPPVKSVFVSKTILVNLLIALGTAYPPVGQFVSAHPNETLLALGALNIALRWISKGRVNLFGSDA